MWRVLRRVSSLTDIPRHSLTNNSETKNDNNSNVAVSSFSFKDLPIISAVTAVVLILIYNLSEWFGIKAEMQVSVSWEAVVLRRELWRILVAHIFHFSRINLMINVTSLMALGRYLERKIRPFPMLILLQVMGMVASVFHMLISTYICQNPISFSTVGFSHVIFALKLVQLLSKEAGQRRTPTLLLGIIPIYLGTLAPWEPLIENVLSDVVVKGKNFATHMSGVVSGLCFPLLDYYLHDIISVPVSEISLTFARSSTSTDADVVRSSSSLEADAQLQRVMKLVRPTPSEAESVSRVKLFHEMPSQECISLFHRRQSPLQHTMMKSKSQPIHRGTVPESTDSYLFLKRKDN